MQNLPKRGKKLKLLVWDRPKTSSLQDNAARLSSPNVLLIFQLMMSLLMATLTVVKRKRSASSIRPKSKTLYREPVRKQAEEGRPECLVNRAAAEPPKSPKT